MRKPPRPGVGYGVGAELGTKLFVLYRVERRPPRFEIVSRHRDYAVALRRLSHLMKTTDARLVYLRDRHDPHAGHGLVPASPADVRRCFERPSPEERVTLWTEAKPQMERIEKSLDSFVAAAEQMGIADAKSIAARFRLVARGYAGVIGPREIAAAQKEIAARKANRGR